MENEKRLELCNELELAIFTLEPTDCIVLTLAFEPKPN